jgi:hypothetical protein
MRWTFFAFLFLSLACSKTQEPSSVEPAPAAESEAQATKRPAPPAKPEPPTIELLEQGQEPRHTLRRSVEPGAEQKLSLTTKIAVEALFQGVLHSTVDYPTVTYELSTKANDGAPGEGTTVSITVDKVSLLDRSTIAEPQRDDWKKAASMVEGATGSYTFGARGWVENVKIKLEPRAYTLPKARQMVDDLEWSLTQLSMPLPEEPVGKGAKWTVKGELAQGGVKVDQDTTVELLAANGPDLDVKMEIEQTATPQEYSQPGGAGDKLKLMLLETTGGGEATWNLKTLAPPSLSFETIEKKQATHHRGDTGVIADLATTRTVNIGSE